MTSKEQRHIQTMSNMTMRLLLCAMCILGCQATHAQSDEQYYAALGSIQTDAAYHIYTTQDGTAYYLTTEGTLTPEKTQAGRFIFRQTSGSQLFRSPGWATDNNFTNPQLSGGQQGSIVHLGRLLTNSAGRDDWEGQVWYKQGNSYAVRATNAKSQSWGAASYWVTIDSNQDGQPEADYDWQPQYVWQLAQTELPTDEETYQRLTNLPHIYINTFNGGNITSKTSYVYAKMRYVDEHDSIATYDSLQIRGRGNSTWNLAKKPYKLKFHEKEKLLGKGYAKAKKWTLLANHGDKTMLRNALTSVMGEHAGLPFNPAAKFVDLTLNGQYVGTYQLSDQIEVRPHRVNIAEQDYPLTEQSDISGGYLLEVDGFFDFHTGYYWDSESGRQLPPDGFYTSASRVPVRIHYPDADEIDQQQTQYINNHVNQFESMLFANDFTQPDGWRSMVDSVTLADWYICTELSGNIDGFFSTYFYKEQADDRLRWGPLWDYDIAYGNDNRLGDTSHQLMKDVGYGTAGNGCVPWVQRFWQDPWFATMIYRRYTELLDQGMEQHLLSAIDSLVQVIDQSQQLNYQRWSINSRTLRERILYSSYDQYISDLRQYVITHTAYLKTTFAQLAGQEPGDDPQPVEQGFVPDDGACYAITNAGSATRMDANMQSMDVCCNAADDASHTQQWLIRQLDNGYMHLTNRATGMALNDPTRGLPTATTLLGDTLNIVPADTTDTRQQWQIVAQSGDRYNLVNRYSQHVGNLMGGNRADGTPVLSYTNNEANATSNNRMWYINAIDQIDTGIDTATPPADYVLAYDPDGQRLHFGAEQPSLLHFTAKVYNQSGRLVRTFTATEDISTAAWPTGIYIIAWQEQGRTRHAKLLIREK